MIVVFCVCLMVLRYKCKTKQQTFDKLFFRLVMFGNKQGGQYDRPGFRIGPLPVLLHSQVTLHFVEVGPHGQSCQIRPRCYRLAPRVCLLYALRVADVGSLYQGVICAFVAWFNNHNQIHNAPLCVVVYPDQI